MEDDFISEEIEHLMIRKIYYFPFSKRQILETLLKQEVTLLLIYGGVYEVMWPMEVIVVGIVVSLTFT